MPLHIANAVGFDDGPFRPGQDDPVPLVGAVCSSARLDGILLGEATRDGADATDRIVSLLGGSKFIEAVRVVLLQGVTVAGFNIIDVGRLSRQVDMPVIVVARHRPDLEGIRAALCRLFDDGEERFECIEALGPMQPMGGVYAQWVGTDESCARATIEHLAVHGLIPEPLRVAHLVAGALVDGASRGRA